MYFSGLLSEHIFPYCKRNILDHSTFSENVFFHAKMYANVPYGFIDVFHVCVFMYSTIVTIELYFFNL